MTTEDFSLWTESDPAGRLSKTSSRVTWTNLNRTDVNTYVWDDKTGELQNFTRYFTLRITAIQSATQTNRANPLVASEFLDDYTDVRLGNYESFGVMIRSESSIATFSLLPFETNNGSAYVYGAANNLLNVNTTYYCKVVKSGTSWKLFVYTDANFTIEEPDYVGGFELTLHGNWNLQYMMVSQSINLANSVTISGYLEELKDSLVTDGTQNLHAEFQVANPNWIDLKASFEVAQSSVDLNAEFFVNPTEIILDLKAVFWVRQTGTRSLFAKFETSTVTAPPIEVWGTMYVSQQYDLSTARGIGFYWWGAGGLDQLNEFILETPTGFYRGYFADGEAKWNWAFFLMADLEELALDGSRPDPTDITGILWTYHSNGLRRVAFLSIWYVEPPDLKAILTVRHSDTLELSAEFVPIRTGTPLQLKAEFRLRQETADLKAEFTVNQYNGEANLHCEFVVGELIDVYTMIGTSGSTYFTAGNTLIPEMTKDLTCKAGDLIIAHFDGTFLPNDGQTFKIQVKIEGVTIGQELMAYKSGITIYMPLTLTRAYEIPLDGDYTIEIWINVAGMSNVQAYQNYRTLTIQHVH